jgi:hypothetical protein
MRSRRWLRRGGLSLVSVLIALAIIAILAVLLISTVTGGSKKGSGSPGGPIQKARGMQCPENLKFIRAMLLDYETQGESFPAQLRDGGPGSVTRCPQTDQAYSYDPRTGQVWCTTSGHENF